MEAVAPDAHDRGGGRDEPLAEHLAGRPARDPRARPEPRLHPERRCSRRSSSSARSSCRRSCSAMTTATKVGVVEPAPAGLEVGDRRRSAARFDRRSSCRTYPDRAAAECGPRPTARSRPSSTSRPTCPGRARSGSTRRPDQATAQMHRRPRSIGLRVAGRPRCERRRSGGARRRPAAAGGRRPRPADRGRPGALPRRQHRRGRSSSSASSRFGFTVLTGVVEEKQSRVVEVVLVDGAGRATC